MAPARSADLRPPLIWIGERNGMMGRGKHHRARHQALGRRPGKIFGARRSLGDGDVTRRFHEERELFVRHFGRIHPEAVHEDAMHRSGISRGLHPDSVVHVRAGPARPSRIPRRESTPCRRAQARAADSCFRRSEEIDADVAASAAGSAWSAGGLGRVAVKATIAAAAIVTTATHVHALLLRRGTDTVLIDFERRLLIGGSGRIIRMCRLQRRSRTVRGASTPGLQRSAPHTRPAGPATKYRVRPSIERFSNVNCRESLAVPLIGAQMCRVARWARHSSRSLTKRKTGHHRECPARRAAPAGAIGRSSFTSIIPKV